MTESRALFTLGAPPAKKNPARIPAKLLAQRLNLAHFDKRALDIAQFCAMLVHERSTSGATPEGTWRGADDVRSVKLSLAIIGASAFGLLNKQERAAE